MQTHLLGVQTPFYPFSRSWRDAFKSQQTMPNGIGLVHKRRRRERATVGHDLIGSHDDPVGLVQVLDFQEIVWRWAQTL